MATNFSNPKFRGYVQSTNAPLAGGKLYVYENGTTNPTTSYDDKGGSANANPVILDANGEADVWLPPGALYTLKLDNSADVEQWSKDNVPPSDITTFIASGSDAYFTAGQVYIGATSGSEDLTVVGTASISSTLEVTGATTLTGAATLTAAPTLSSLTASQAVFSDASKGLVSNAITGTGSVVMSASPTLTGTIGAASQTLSGTLGVTGVATFTAQPILSSLTASLMVATDGSKGLVSVAKSSAYTPTNVTTTRTYDADSSSVAELGDVLGTLIADLQTANILA